MFTQEVGNILRTRFEEFLKEVDDFKLESEKYILDSAKEKGIKDFKIVESGVDWNKSFMLSLFKFIYIIETGREKQDPEIEDFLKEMEIGLVLRRVGARFIYEDDIPPQYYDEQDKKPTFLN